MKEKMKSINIRMSEIFFPLSAKRREGCQAKRWQGELNNEAALTAIHGGDFTHPNVASLVHPLFRKRERGSAAGIFKVLNIRGFNLITVGVMIIIILFNAC